MARTGWYCAAEGDRPNITAGTVMREFVHSARWLAIAVAILHCGIAPRVARAQLAGRLDLGGAVEVGGEAARYLRILQLSDSGPGEPWTILPFGPSTERALRPEGAHP